MIATGLPAVNVFDCSEQVGDVDPADEYFQFVVFTILFKHYVFVQYKLHEIRQALDGYHVRGTRASSVAESTERSGSRHIFIYLLIYHSTTASIFKIFLSLKNFKKFSLCLRGGGSY